MNVLDDIIDNLPEDEAVRTVLIGLHWTVVCSRHCGMAATLTGDKHQHPHGHVRLQEAGRLHHKDAHELARMAYSDNLLEASIGVAAINSLLTLEGQDNCWQVQEINAADVLVERGKEAKVAMVGHFPFVPRLRAAVGQLWVIEKTPAADEYPTEAASELIPQADVVAITGSALINHSLDGLLTLCQSNALVMILGPSTPLAPVLFKRGVTLISGTRVIDEAAVLRTVSQGANFRQVEGVQLLTLSRKGAII